MANRHMRPQDDPTAQDRGGAAGHGRSQVPAAGTQEPLVVLTSTSTDAGSRTRREAAEGRPSHTGPSRRRASAERPSQPHRRKPTPGDTPGTGRRRSAGEADPPKRRRSSSQVLSTVLIVAGVVLLLVAGGMWGFAQFRYWKQDQITTTLQKTAIVEEPTEEKPYPDIDWEALKAVNADVCGWIYVPGTVINYPIYQGVDNDQYLRTTATGEWSVGGQLFLDYENTNPGMVDHQSIIYGHHMLDGTLFQPIAWLEDQAEFDKIETLWYLTETNAYELEPLLLYYTVPTDTEVRRFRFDSNNDFRAYLFGLLDRAVSRRADADKIIPGAKHVLTLSTCNYYDEWGRTIFLAIPKSEAKGALDGTTAAEEAAAAATLGQTQEPPTEGEEGEGTEFEETEELPEGEYVEEYQEGYYDESGEYVETYYEDQAW